MVCVFHNEFFPFVFLCFLSIFFQKIHCFVFLKKNNKMPTMVANMPARDPKVSKKKGKDTVSTPFGQGGPSKNPLGQEE